MYFLSLGLKGLRERCKWGKVRVGSIIIFHQINPFTPKSDQCQNSPAASQEIWHHTVRRTWLFIAYSDEKWLYYKFLLHHSYNRFLKGWENTLFELRSERVKLWETTFSLLCDVKCLVRLQGKFDIHHTWEWKGAVYSTASVLQWSAVALRIGARGTDGGGRGGEGEFTPQPFYPSSDFDSEVRVQLAITLLPKRVRTWVGISNAKALGIVWRDQTSKNHYNCGCLCSQVHSNCTAAAFFLDWLIDWLIESCPSKRSQLPARFGNGQFSWTWLLILFLVHRL